MDYLPRQSRAVAKAQLRIVRYLHPGAFELWAEGGRALRGLRTRLGGAGAVGSWERSFCQPGPGPCTLGLGTVGLGSWGPWGREVVGLSVLGSGVLGPRHCGVGYSGAWAVGLRVLGPWGRVFGGRGVGCSGLGDRGVECLGAGGREVVGSGVVSQGGRGSLHRVLGPGRLTGVCLGSRSRGFSESLVSSPPWGS